MKTTLLSLAALATIVAAGSPAAAQDWRGHGDHRGHRDGGQQQSATGYADSFDWKINHAVDTGMISRREAQRLRWQVEQVKGSAWRIQTGQARQGERARFYETLGRIDARLSESQRYVDRGRDYGDRGRDYGGRGDYRR